MRFQAKHIDEMKPGERVRIDGRVYMRVTDSPRNHMEGFIVDLENGWLGHWSPLVLWSEMVEAVPKEQP